MYRLNALLLEQVAGEQGGNQQHNKDEESPGSPKLSFSSFRRVCSNPSEYIIRSLIASMCIKARGCFFYRTGLASGTLGRLHTIRVFFLLPLPYRENQSVKYLLCGLPHCREETAHLKPLI